MRACVRACMHACMYEVARIPDSIYAKDTLVDIPPLSFYSLIVGALDYYSTSSVDSPS